MTMRELGQMELIFNKVLIARSSGDILFFKIEKDEDNKEYKWVQYHEIELRGFIYFIKGNVRF